MRFWAALGSAVVSAGCPAQKPPELPAPVAPRFENVEVRLLLPSGTRLADEWAPAFNDWADTSGATVHASEFTFADDAADRLSQRGSESATIVLAPDSFVNRCVAEGRAAPIPPEILDAGVIAWGEIPPGVRQALGVLGDVPALVPVTTSTPLVCYRADLLQTAKKQAAATWDQYDELVRTLPEWAPGLTAVEPRAKPYATTLFLARAISGAKHPSQFSVELDAATGEPLIATAPFVTALQEMLSLKPHLAGDVGSLSPSECLRRVRAGEAAMAIVWEVPGEAAAAAATASPSGVLTFAPLPGRKAAFDRDAGEWTALPGGGINRPALCGFSGCSVCVLRTTSPAEQSASWRLWGFLEAYMAEGTIPPPPGTLVRRQAVAKPPAWLHMSAEENRDYQLAVTANLQNPTLVCELPLAGRERLRSELADAIDSVLQGQATPQAALLQAARTWTTIIDEIGRQRVLNAYRQRLGLLPLTE